MDGKLLKALLLFLAGLTIGGVLVGLVQPSREKSEGSGAVVSPRVVKRPPAENEAKKSVSSGELTRIGNSRERRARVEGMGDAELQGMIEALLKDADPFKGFSYKQKSLLNDILNELAGRDFEGALTWVDVQLAGTLRSYAYQRILKDHVGKEKPREAMDLYEAGGFEQEEVSDFAGSLLLSAVDLIDEDAIYLLQKSFHEGSSSSGSQFEVAEGFDYAAFAEAAIKLKLEGGDRKMTFSRFPTNLFEDWAKKDAHGAMEFYSKYYLSDRAVKLSFNGIEELAKGYVATASRQDVLEWTTEIIANPEIPVRERTELIEFLADPDNGSQDLLGEIGSAIDDRDQSIEFSKVALNGSMLKTKPAFFDALELFPDNESRLLELERLAGRKYHSEKLRDGSDRLFEDLANLGHGEADIQRIATALEKGK